MMCQWLPCRRLSGLGQVSGKLRAIHFFTRAVLFLMGRNQQLRKERVGIALDERATSAWREAGEKWKAVSSCTVTA